MRAWLAATVSAAAFAAAAVTASAPAFAEPPPRLPVADFTRSPKLGQMQASPDGKRFAVLEEFRGRMNLVVGSFDGGPLTRVTGYEKEGDVGAFAWVTDRHVGYTLYDSQRGLAEQRGGGFFVVTADGSSGREVSPPAEGCITADKLNFACRYTVFHSRVRGSSREIVVVSNDRSAQSPDLYRYDLETGRRTLLTTDNPGRVTSWVLDAQGRPRAAVSRAGRTLQNTFWFKADPAGPWREVAAWKDGQPGMWPLDFAADGTLYVASTRRTDTAAIFRFDATTGAEGERLAFHPRFDLSGDPESGLGHGSPLIFDGRSGELVGIRVTTEREETFWLREAEQRVQATLDGALKGAVNRFQRIGDDRYFVRSWSDRDPGTYFILDRAKRELKEVGRPRDWIRPQQMAAVESVTWTARDGMPMQGYLTLPAGRERKGLPLLVWVHGGPWTRDGWGFDPQVQFIANRGYAVFQPNYRGSAGLGLKHLTAGFRQLGQAMQDDVADGVEHLVKQGWVDRDRVCIGGGSYGGYATMMGLVRHPELYRCGINVVGVTDLFWWIELGYTDFNMADAESANAYLTMAVGDPARDADMMRANSPRFLAERVRAPVLIVHGGGDRRVPVRHGEAMRDALRSAGKSVDWVVYPEEGHGFLKESNRADFYGRVERFLDQHIGRSAP